MNTPPSSSPSGSTPCPATDAANAPVGIQPRQRATSSDSIPGAKRSKFNSYPPPHLSLDLDLESATLEHWRHSAATTPSDDALEAAADQFEQSLAALEDSSSWGSSFSSTPSSLASETSVALAASSRVQGVRTNLPTPSATPQSTSYQAYDHASPATLHSRPPHLRSSTLPLASSKSLTAKALARATALAAGVMGSEREIQAGGPVEVISSVPGSSMLGLGMPERRSSDPTPQPVEALSSKERFVAGLVGASVLAIESIWGPTAAPDPSTPPESSVLPLQWFVKEVLRRSRTSCSTLQLALYYLHKARRDIRDVVAKAETCRQELAQPGARAVIMAEQRHRRIRDAYPSPPLSPVDSIDSFALGVDVTDVQNSPILCGRRMFLASLIAASKFLQDRNYSNHAWAKISGLPTTEINVNERSFLNMMKFELHIGAEDFHKWTERLASLAVKGAVVESASTAATSKPDRFGLSRSASEYPAAPSTQELRATVSPSSLPRPTTVLGRSNSHLELESKRRQSNPPSRPIAPSSTLRPQFAAAESIAIPRQMVSPEDSSSSEEEEEITRRVRAMPKRPSLAVKTSSSSSSRNVPKTWSTAQGMEVDSVCGDQANAAWVSDAVPGTGAGSSWTSGAGVVAH